MPVDDTGAWLVAHRDDMDRGEAVWLQALARFDLDQGWYTDGQLSCAEWLMLRTNMARATAFEKLRVARQLHRRPLIADAFVGGRLSYSAVRVITRIDDPDPDVDAALVDLAEAGTISDLERAVRAYERYADQDRPPPDPSLRRQVRSFRHYDGTGEVQVTLTEVELEEFAVALQAFLDLQDHAPAGEQSPREDSAESARDAAPAAALSPYRDSPESPTAPAPSELGRAFRARRVEQSPAGDSAVTIPLQAPAGRRADALMDLVRVGLAHAGDGHAVGDDRYLVHLIRTDEGDVTLVDGTPLDEEAVSLVACDASTVEHHHSPAGEPLYLGRRHRRWSTAQRRAALIRDGGHCRFPGCSRRIADLHHQHPWAAGGPTDLDNGFLSCPHHHTLLHRGFQARGNPNGTLTFYRPDGAPIGSTSTTKAGAFRPARSQATLGR